MHLGTVNMHVNILNILSRHCLYIKEYIKIVIPKFIRYLLVTWLGLTILFIISRSSPIDPTTLLISRLTASFGANLLPQETLESFRRTVLSLFGRDKPLFLQYIDYLKSVITYNFGPSFSYFPIPATDIVLEHLPWTVALLSLSIPIAWILGFLTGIIASLFENRMLGKILKYYATALFPLPFVYLSLIMFLLFTTIIKIYTIAPGGGFMSFKLDMYTIYAFLKKAWLPALSFVLLSSAGWLLSTKSIADAIKTEDFVTYARLRGIPEGIISMRYILRPASLPQITGLALSLGGMFSGALVLEQVFSYPGLGVILSSSIISNDYTTMLAVASLSIIGVSTAAFILDIIYPLIDPRVRYRAG